MEISEVEAAQTSGLVHSELSLRAHPAPLSERVRTGKGLRKRASRSSHASWKPLQDRDPVSIVTAVNEGRLPELVPIRMGRMAASPFAFFRGSAGLMAFDLRSTPNSGLFSWICGDAHLSNFGVFASPEQVPVFDLNDFDETTVGPWEWDVKRLGASIVLAGRERGISGAALGDAVAVFLSRYRATLAQLSQRKLLDAYRLRWQKGDLKQFIAKSSRERFRKAVAKAETRTNDHVLHKLTVLDAENGWQFAEQPPLLTRVSRDLFVDIAIGLEGYTETLLSDRRDLVNAYGIQDVARKVVGVGSVGTRAYVVMLSGNGEDDALFLQLKEAPGSQLAPYLPRVKDGDEAARVVAGQRALQALTDPFLGFTEIGGRAYYVRQLKDMKGSVDLERINQQLLHDYSILLGGTLAMAHGRTSDPALLTGYLGQSDRFDRAIVEFSTRYADQAESDYEQFLNAIEAGKIAAERGI